MSMIAGELGGLGGALRDYGSDADANEDHCEPKKHISKSHHHTLLMRHEEQSLERHHLRVGTVARKCGPHFIQGLKCGPMCCIEGLMQAGKMKICAAIEEGVNRRQPDRSSQIAHEIIECRSILDTFGWQRSQRDIVDRNDREH